MALMRSVATIGGVTMVSRLLGFLRDTLFAAILGAGMAADCFMIAFRLPNFFRALFAEGAFSAAFVPLYSRILVGPDGPKRAAHFAGEIATLLVLTVTSFVTLAIVFMPQLMHVLAPGFVDEPEKFNLAVVLTQLAFPYLGYISLVSLLGAILNAHQRFAAPAATPILLNLVLCGALLLPFKYLDPAHNQAVAITVAGMAQFIWLAIHLRRIGIKLYLFMPRLDEHVRRFFRLLMPAVIGAGIYQVNVLIDTMIASLLPSGAVSYLFYADRLNQLPLAVIGIAISTALLPLLSRQLAAGDIGSALTSQNRALEGAMFMTLPAAAALATIPQTIIGVLFQHGAFNAHDTEQTARALAMLALGLPAFTATKVFTPAFHAREDTRTPMRLAAIALGVNLVVALSLMGPMQQAGLSLASTVAAWLNMFQLVHILRKRGNFSPDARLIRRGIRLVVATAIMVAVLLTLDWLLAPYFAGTLLWRIGALVALVGAGGLSFLLASLLTGAIDRDDLRRLIRRG
ncbi:murein biosynthesis integral membrane protein MurJ [Zavarzinia sp.]|uniref:murein biosynthesis integral membrane protein MurJ n=1 Tax=Zavarzinia sp. TaxID=2027920 RepID=UPI003564FADA